MRTNLRNQLAELDRTLLALLNERARLVAESGGAVGTPFVDDLLQRSPGPFRADAVREVFRWIEAGCGGESR